MKSQIQSMNVMRLSLDMTAIWQKKKLNQILTIGGIIQFNRIKRQMKELKNLNPQKQIKKMLMIFGIRLLPHMKKEYNQYD